MTAMVAVLGSRAPIDLDTVRQALLHGGARAGRRCVGVQHGGDTLGVSRPEAVGVADAMPESMLARDERYTVIADATLYYKADLQRKILLRAGRSGAGTPAELILDAYRAFGDDCVDFIEGDFAFVVWDRQARRLFCARDLSGRRPLFFTRSGDGLAVASTLGILASLPGIRAEPDLATVGANAAGLFFAIDDETAMHGARSLGAGCSMAWRAGQPPTIRRYWTAETSGVGDLPFDEGAEVLRALLRTATTERLADGAPTAVWMSGGRDSSAVFASAMAAIRDDGLTGSVFPVSRSHPVGDPEREDEAIDAIARFWSVSPSWISARDIALFGDDVPADPWSTEPFEQPFVRLTTALARATAAGGAAVALDGHGGDFLFQVSRAYLADLVARGRLTQAWRDWRTMDVQNEGIRGLARAALQPQLNRWARRIAPTVMHPRFRGPMERVAPPWIRSDFLARHGLAERCRVRGPDAQSGHDAADRETRFCLTHPFFANVNAAMAGYALQHGVELRSPLLDQRVVSFALTRPRTERNQAGDQKRLLRRAMSGLLPDSALEPRRGKTGTLRTYFAYHMCHDGLARLRQLQRRSVLAEYGIVEARALSGAVDDFARRGVAYPHMEALFCTLRAEEWGRVNTVGTHSMHAARRSA